MYCFFDVPGVPKAKGRPRMTRSGHTYTPKETARYENLVRLAAQSSRIDFIANGPVTLRLWFFWPCKSPRKAKPRPATYRTARPDLDNLIKAVSDALNGIGYRDDSQVVSVTAVKQYAAQDEAPHTRVEIERFEVIP